MNTMSLFINNSLAKTIHHMRIFRLATKIGLTGKISLAQRSIFSGHFCLISGSPCASERLETCSDIGTVTFYSSNSAIHGEEYHHYIESDDRKNTQHTTNPVETLNNETHEDTAHNKIPHDDFDTSGILFTEHHSEYFKSFDGFSKETPRGANCYDREGLEDDPDNTQRYRFEDEIADSFEEDVVLSAADRFRCFIHAVYDIIIAPSYRIHKKVKKIRVYPDNCFFGVCPRCNNSIDREYQTFCNCCGQRLDWSKLDEAEEQWIGRHK